MRYDPPSGRRRDTPAARRKPAVAASRALGDRATDPRAGYAVAEPTHPVPPRLPSRALPGDGTVESLPKTQEVAIPLGREEIRGDLALPLGSLGVVVFAHGSGSSRKSPRNRWVAAELQTSGIATLLFDLLTPEEERRDLRTGEFRFDIPRLSGRLVEVIDWVAQWSETRGTPLGLYGASTGGAAALIAAASRPDAVRAVVLRGARSDLADARAREIRSPTLLLVGGRDPEIRRLNEATYRKLVGPKKLIVIPGATHLFEEPGALEEVSRQAREWFLSFLPVHKPA